MSSTAKDHLEQIAAGFQQARILLTAVELNVFTALGRKGLKGTEVARMTETAPGPMVRLLNALVGLKVLTKKDGIFRNTPGATRHLADGSPEPLKHIMLHRNNMWSTWSHLTRIVRTGKVPPRKRTPQHEDSFIRGMANIGFASAAETVQALAKEMKSAKRLLDVGGGPAVYACAFAGSVPGLTATVLDLPGPLRIARETIKQLGMKGRVKVKAADVLEAPSLGKGYDVVFMSNLIHSFERPVAKVLVEKSARALKPGGRLIIKDFYILKDGTLPVFTSMFSINMLVADAGDCFTRAEVENWMAAGGITAERFVTVAKNSGILVGKKGTVPI